MNEAQFYTAPEKCSTCESMHLTSYRSENSFIVGIFFFSFRFVRESESEAWTSEADIQFRNWGKFTCSLSIFFFFFFLFLCTRWVCWKIDLENFLASAFVPGSIRNFNAFEIIFNKFFRSTWFKRSNNSLLFYSTYGTIMLNDILFITWF